MLSAIIHAGAARTASRLVWLQLLRDYNKLRLLCSRQRRQVCTVTRVSGDAADSLRSNPCYTTCSICESSELMDGNNLMAYTRLHASAVKAGRNLEKEGGWMIHQPSLRVNISEDLTKLPASDRTETAQSAWDPSRRPFSRFSGPAGCFRRPPELCASAQESS